MAVKTLQVGHIGQIHHQVWQARNHWSLCPLTLRGPGLRLVQTRETAFPPIDEALKLRVLDSAALREAAWREVRMRSFVALLFVVASLGLIGCGQIDFVVDGAQAPDSGMPLGDGGPMFMGDTGMLTVDAGPGVDTGIVAPDTGVVGEDASGGQDAGTSPDDAAVVSATCGNAVLDPGEACDPGHFVGPASDGGVRVVRVDAADLAMCPDADCGRIACPGGAVVSGRYCVYVGNPPASGGSLMGLSWHDAAERDLQVQAIRSLMPPSSTWTGLIALYGGPNAYDWSPPYWQSAHVRAWCDTSVISCPATSGTDIPWAFASSTRCGSGSGWRVSMTVRSAAASAPTVACVNTGVTVQAFSVVFPINAPTS